MTGLKKLTFSTIEGGLLAGAFVYKYEFNNDQEFDVAGSINLLKGAPKAAKKAVYLVNPGQGRFDNELRTMCRALKDNGYFTIEESAPEAWESHYLYLDYLILNITDALWPGFNANEIRYTPSDMSSKQEPILPATRDNIRLYLVPPEGSKIEDVLNFVQQSRNTWSLYSPMQKRLNLPIYEETKE